MLRMFFVEIDWDEFVFELQENDIQEGTYPRPSVWSCASEDNHHIVQTHLGVEVIAHSERDTGTNWIALLVTTLYCGKDLRQLQSKVVVLVVVPVCGRMSRFLKR